MNRTQRIRRLRVMAHIYACGTGVIFVIVVFSVWRQINGA